MGLFQEIGFFWGGPPLNMIFRSLYRYKVIFDGLISRDRFFWGGSPLKEEPPPPLELTFEPR